MKVVGNKIYEICPDCAKLVQVNKTFFGSLHICTLPEERQQYGQSIKEQYKLAKHQLENL